MNVEVPLSEERPALPASATGELAEALGRVEHVAGPGAEVSVAAQRPDTVGDVHGGELQGGCSEPAGVRAPALQEGAAKEMDPVFKTPVKRQKGRVRSKVSEAMILTFRLVNELTGGYGIVCIHCR